MLIFVHYTPGDWTSDRGKASRWKSVRVPVLDGTNDKASAVVQRGLGEGQLPAVVVVVVVFRVEQSNMCDCPGRTIWAMKRLCLVRALRTAQES